MPLKNDLKRASDGRLLDGVFEILRRTHQDEADFVAYIAEIDARKLYARQAAPSMFAWCLERLGFTEQEAYLRIAAARASREHPMLLALLREGRLHVSAIARLAPHLTRKNRDAVLNRAAGMTLKQVMELVAELAPKPDVPDRIRKRPDRSAATAAPAFQLCSNRVEPPDGAPSESLGPLPQEPPPAQRPGRRPTVSPLAPERYKIEFTASAELKAKLEHLQALKRASLREPDLATVIDQAVTHEIERLEAKRFGKTAKPRKSLKEASTTPNSRYIPAPVRRAVEKRDGGRCAYRDGSGRRCRQRHDLEFHHRKPFGRGGSHSPDVLCLMCPPHNQLMAEEDYGKEVMARFRRSSGRVSEPAPVYAIRTAPTRPGRPPG